MRTTRAIAKTFCVELESELPSHTARNNPSSSAVRYINVGRMRYPLESHRQPNLVLEPRGWLITRGEIRGEKSVLLAAPGNATYPLVPPHDHADVIVCV